MRRSFALTGLIDAAGGIAPAVHQLPVSTGSVMRKVPAAVVTVTTPVFGVSRSKATSIAAASTMTADARPAAS